MQYFRCASTLNISERLELKDFSWTYTMIKAKHYTFKSFRIIEFDEVGESVKILASIGH